MNQIRTGKAILVHPALRAAVVILLAMLLAACAAAPPQKAALAMNLQAAPDVNPDQQGRPSPIIVHIMELKSVEQFNSLDYMSLTDPSGGALGADMVSRNQIILSPGASRQIPMELDAATTSIGLVAGYRDIDNATWRQAVSITQGTTTVITVNLRQSQLSSSAQ